MKKVRILLAFTVSIFMLTACNLQNEENNNNDEGNENTVAYEDLQKGRYLNQGMYLQVYHPLTWKLKVGTAEYARFQVPDKEDDIVIYNRKYAEGQGFDDWIKEENEGNEVSLNSWTYTSKLGEEIEVKENEEGNEYYIDRGEDVIVFQNGTGFYGDEYLIPKEDFDKFVQSYDYFVVNPI